MDNSNLKKFIFWNKISLLFLFLLIIAGGLVRSTGSGMGCPDWPKCFGQYIPPISVEQLPSNYKEIYAHRGYRNTDFNVFKTYTEYVNRLIGAITGVFIFLTFFYSIKQKRYTILWILSLFGFLLTGFQAWLGGRVVETNLQATIITAHMLIALLIIGVFIISYLIGKEKLNPSILKLKLRTKITLILYSIFLLFLFLLQVAKGTEVRELVDEAAIHFDNASRGEWLDYIGRKFYEHRNFSQGILVAFLGFLFLTLKNIYLQKKYKFLILSAIILVFLQAFTGMVLSTYAIPAVFQTMHLVLAAALFMVLVFIIGNLLISKQENPSI